MLSRKFTCSTDVPVKSLTYVIFFNMFSFLRSSSWSVVRLSSKRTYINDVPVTSLIYVIVIRLFSFGGFLMVCSNVIM